MVRQRLVLFKGRPPLHFPGAILNPHEGVEPMNKLIKEFESGELRTMYIPDSLGTGWKFNVPQKDIDFVFIGTWRANEILQAIHRTKGGLI